MRYIPATVLLNAVCAAPQLAAALELRLDETMPAAAPAAGAVTGAAFPVWSLVSILLLCLAIYLGWRFGSIRYVSQYKNTLVRLLSVGRRVFHLTGRHLSDRRERSRQPERPAHMAQYRRPLPTHGQSPAKTVADLAWAKKLTMDEAYDQAEIFAISAIRSEPYNLDAYVVALKILARYQTPQLIGLVRGGLQLLRRKNPRLWRDVAEQGRKLAPEIENWDDDPLIKRDSEPKAPGDGTKQA